MNKVYCITDLHGNYKLWETVKNILDDTDILYCLGDNTDRGKNGVKITLEMLEDDRVILLKGNHELYLETFLEDLLLPKEFQEWELDKYVWAYNGGQTTKKEIDDILGAEDGEEIIKKLYSSIKQLPHIKLYTNKEGKFIYLNHPGFSSYQFLNKYSRELLKKELCENKDVKINLEDRESVFENKWYGGDNEYIVFGHTPAQLIGADLGRPYYICEDHKIGLDMGTPASNMIILFDLDHIEKDYPHMIIKE